MSAKWAGTVSAQPGSCIQTGMILSEIFFSGRRGLRALAFFRPHVKNETSRKSLPCKGFANYPARIRTWTKRAKISCATVTLPGIEDISQKVSFYPKPRLLTRDASAARVAGAARTSQTSVAGRSDMQAAGTAKQPAEETTQGARGPFKNMAPWPPGGAPLWTPERGRASKVSAGGLSALFYEPLRRNMSAVFVPVLGSWRILRPAMGFAVALRDDF